MNDIMTGELSDLRLFADPFEAFTGVPDVDGWKADFVRKGEDIAIQREADGTIRTLAGPGQRKIRNFKGLIDGVGRHRHGSRQHAVRRRSG